jgi:hypothetical protein
MLEAMDKGFRGINPWLVFRHSFAYTSLVSDDMALHFIMVV